MCDYRHFSIEILLRNSLCFHFAPIRTFPIEGLDKTKRTRDSSLTFCLFKNTFTCIGACHHSETSRTLNDRLYESGFGQILIMLTFTVAMVLYFVGKCSYAAVYSFVFAFSYLITCLSW